MALSPVNGNRGEVEMNRHNRVDEEDNASEENAPAKEDDGIMKKLGKGVRALDKGTLKSAGYGVAAMAVAAIVLLYLMPKIIGIDVFSPTTSSGSYALIFAVAGIAAAGVWGFSKGTAGKSKILTEIWNIVRPILTLLIAVGAIYYGVHTLKDLNFDQLNTYRGLALMFGGPALISFLAIGAGTITLLAYPRHLFLGR